LTFWFFEVKQMKKGSSILIIMTLVVSVLAGTVIATRANDDTSEDATEIVLDETVNDSLTENDDMEDWYKIDLVGGDLVRIYMTLPAVADFDLVLFDSNEVYINSSEGIDADEEIIFGVGATGLYYILAYVWEGSGNYELEVTKIGEFVSDGDDTAGNATEINLGQLVRSDLDPDNYDSVDWYKINLDAGDVINATFNVPANGIFEIAAYNSEIHYLGGTYAFFQPVVSMEYGIPSSGFYYISIQSMMGGGDYSFTSRKVGTFTPDGDNDMGNATEIPDLPFDTWGDFGTEYDLADWYYIDLTDGDNVTVYLDVPNDADLDVSARTEDEYYGGGFEDTGDDERFFFEADSSEAYYIVVEFLDAGSDFPVHYHLALDYTDNVMDEDDDNAFGNATPIDPPESFTDELHHLWDSHDYYTLEAGDEREEIITLDISLPASSYMEVTLWDTDEVWLGSRNISEGRSAHSLSFEVQEEDDYFIVLYMFGGGGEYTMDVDLISNNLPPEIVDTLPAAALIEVNEGESISFSVDVEDEEVDDLEFEWFISGNRQTANTNEFTMNTNFIGPLSEGDYGVEVMVFDEDDLMDNHSWRVVVNDVNRLPEIDIEEPALTDISINETESIHFEIEVTDADLTTPTIQWLLDGEELPEETDDEFEFTTDHESEGGYEVSVNVIDAEDDTLVNSTSWKITVLNTDRMLELTNITPEKTTVETDEETSVEFGVDAADPDGEPVTFEWFFDGLILDADGTTYLYEPDYESADDTVHTVMLVATAGGLEVNHTWTLTINNVNRLPELDNTTLIPEPDTKFDSGKDIEFHIEADDPDGGELNYTWFIPETGETFYDQSFYHTLPNGVYHIQVTVEDEDGDKDEYEFVIEVDEPKDSPGFELFLLAFAALAVLAAAGYSGKRR